MKLIGKNILITGAAGRIGSAVAKMAVLEGANIVATDVLKDRLSDLEKSLSDIRPSSVAVIESDVTSEKELQALLPRAHKCFGSVTSAVHCAYPVSSGWGDSFQSMKMENLSLDLTMQLGSAIMFSQKVSNYFLDHGGGDLVHVSSIQGIRAPKFEHYQGTQMSSPIEYAAIKAGVISITRWLAKFYANRGIRVNCVSPGGILDKQPDEFVQQYRQSCTNIGMLSAEQVASSIVYLLSPASMAINGQNLVIDDGWSL